MNFLISCLLILLIGFRFSQGQSISQSGFKFEQIGLEQGLSQSTVNAIVQDAHGFMWFGTDDGLNRYDGYSISIFRHDHGDSLSIADNTITSLLTDHNGDLWVGTMYGGVDRYALKENRFYHYKNSDDDNTISENYITCLFEDSNHNIWVGTRNSGLNMFNPLKGSITTYHSDKKNNKSLSNNSIWAMTEDSSGFLWIATSSGLSKLQLNSSPYKNNFYRSLSGIDVRSLLIDRSAKLWIGTTTGINGINEINNKRSIQSMHEDLSSNLWIASDKGLEKFDRKNGTFQKESGEISQILFEDKSGILWVGTFSRGVMIYDWRRNQFRHYIDTPGSPNSVNLNMITAIIQEKEGGLWVGTLGSGLRRYNSKRGKTANYTFNKKDGYEPDDNKIGCLYESTDGNIWIGTRNGGIISFNKLKNTFTRFKHPGNTFDRIYAFNEDHSGKLLVGTSKGLFILDKGTGIFTRCSPVENNNEIIPVTVIQPDKDGNLWIGTLGNGIYRFNPKTNSFKRYLLSHKRDMNEVNNNVYSIYRDSQDIIWIGTWGAGLIRLNPETEKFTNYTVKNGLPNDVVYSILPDKSGNFWLSTNKGISKFNPSAGTFINFDTRDGLQANEFNQGAYFGAPGGELFFGGVNGFNSFYPDDVEKNLYVPPVYITTLKIFDKALSFPSPVSKINQVELSYSQNFFSLEFVALNFTSPEKNQYSYMLEGFDKTWHNVNASQRYGSYTNVDPGTYIFRVKASNNDGIWNQYPASITIIITPPFWQTWWFRVLAAICIISFFTGLYKYRIYQLLKIEHMRVRIATDLHDELGSNLSGIALASQMTNGLVPSDVQRLRDIRKNALQTIDTMHDIVWFIKPEHDYPAELISKMKELAASLLFNISYNFSCDSDSLADIIDTEDRQNIFLIYKESLTNIVKHAQSGCVDIEIGSNKKKFLLSIKDNGCGFEVLSGNSGDGIRNMQNRAARIHAVLEIQSCPGKGTLILLRKKKGVDTP